MIQIETWTISEKALFKTVKINIKLLKKIYSKFHNGSKIIYKPNEKFKFLAILIFVIT